MNYFGIGGIEMNKQWFKLANRICWTMLIITDALLIFWAIHDVMNNRTSNYIYIGVCVVAWAVFHVLYWFISKRERERIEK